VYLVARMFPVYLQSEFALNFILVVGAVTALYAAIVACCQIDIKRILAFSTISQIAFMMVALGVARPEIHEGLGYMASMFHLFTHAMFKALLFMCAGALIHAIGSNDYTAMGGLRKYMPITHITCLVGCLAIAGIVPFSGFFSKDEILVAVYGYSTFWGVWMTCVAALTAFYMFRMYFLVFWWNEPDYKHRPHDCGWTMNLPLIILAAVSVVAGFIPFGKFVTWQGHEYIIHMDWTVAGVSLVVAFSSIFVAMKLYLRENEAPRRMADSCRTLWKAAHRRFYWDEIYMWVTHKVIFACICRPIAWFDRHIIDGSMDGFAIVANKASWAIRGFQSGSIQWYVWVYLVGALLLGVVTAVCLM
ncbi:MAG: NADH-quinone oxidoreductase subunit L, partial [Paramuribaculum sp.]|nr:NADH-quinone oxidoreductase subunit L [Paramuribaculum sp.]